MVRPPKKDTRAGAAKDGRARVPDRDALLAYMRDHPGAVSVSDLARAFNLKGKERTALRALLKEATEDGLVEPTERRKFSSREALPKVTVLEITGPDTDGELRARPVGWPEGHEPPAIYVAPERGKARPFAPGERILARLTPDEDGGYDAQPMRRLGTAPQEIVGVYELERGQGIIQPTDRRAKYDYGVARRHAHGAEPGDLVRARVLPERRGPLRMAEVVERVGHIDSPGAIGLIALHSNDIPIAFPEAVIDEAEKAVPPPLGQREDLRSTALVTIDDEDARDFDDAVFAEPDNSPDNKSGFRLIVAIADVAYYVRPDSALDREAERRGNSVYLPDRVVPMLPEALSNGLCSLRPDEERAALACHMRITADGALIDHRFTRALMKSKARLTYRIAQAAQDGDVEDLPNDLDPKIVANLYAAHTALLRARRARGTLELELPEYKVRIEDGKVVEIGTRQRLMAHRLIEDFMITANVAAAEALEAKRAPCMYRIHEPPDAAKLEGLRDFIESFGLSLPRGQVVRAQQFADLLEKASQDPSAHIIHESILRTQSQAIYTPRNLGHFGLALRRYAHFTSPIRRYSDLLVHRALIGAYHLGAGGTGREAGTRYDEIGEHISGTERRATAAEREAGDRYMALYLSDRIGVHMQGRITAVTRFGLFVKLDGLGADGLVPLSLLGDERFHHDEHAHAIEGATSGRIFGLGDDVEVEIREADPVTGSLVLKVLRHRPLRRRKPLLGRGRGPGKRKGPPGRGKGPRKGGKPGSGSKKRESSTGGKGKSGKPAARKRRQ